jgi:UDP-GlcNAc:undecaprenyl-phosphate GlcNAc-1-phosphate transferase
MNAVPIFSFLTSFLLAYWFIPQIAKLAQNFQLVDKPNQRKVHVNAVPLVGGLSIFLAVGLTLISSIPLGFNFWASKNILVAIAVLVFLGTLDDKYDIRASLKLAVQLLLAHFLFQQGFKVESFHGLFGIQEISPVMQYLLTLVLITGIVNAFNLMDGVDGLMAGISLVGFITFALLAALLNQTALILIFMAFIGAILAFMKYNFSQKSKVFMGDSGSLMIGLVFAISSLYLLQKSQNTPHISWVLIGIVAVLFIPVFDALRVFRKRAKMGKSPLSADKSHIHHLILSQGMKHKKVSAAIVLIMIGLMIIAYISNQWMGLTLTLALNLVIFYGITSWLQLQANLTIWKGKIAKLESTQVSV